MVDRMTIISDASVCSRSKIAAWAAWVKSDGKTPALFSGQIKRSIQHVHVAEICALANAMHSADAAGLIEDGAEVMLQSDSTIALGIVRKLVPGTVVRNHKDSATISNAKRASTLTGVPAEAALIIAKIVRRRRLLLVIRHVRGHKAGSGRQWVNNQVDRAARKIMRDARRLQKDS